jgi:heme/copper-type cytochrome/quinol oxidase subunit 2
MSKKKRKQRKNTGKAASPKKEPAKQQKSHNRVYVVMAGIVVIVAAAVILFSMDFADSGDNTAGATLDRSSETEAYADQAPSVNVGGPSIYFPEKSHDFDTIPEGAKVSHTFIVKNVGTEPLELIRAKGS